MFCKAIHYVMLTHRDITAACVYFLAVAVTNDLDCGVNAAVDYRRVYNQFCLHCIGMTLRQLQNESTENGVVLFWGSEKRIIAYADLLRRVFEGGFPSRFKSIEQGLQSGG